MNKTNRTLITIAGSAVATYALIVAAFMAQNIIEYDTKDLYSYNRMHNAEQELEQAQEHQSNTFERLTNDNFIYQQLYRDARYSQLFDEYIKLDKKLCNANTYSDVAYQKMWNRRDNLLEEMALYEDSLRNFYIDKHPDMILANKRLRCAQEQFNKAKRHCAIRDSINKIPLNKRIKSNWDKFCKDRQMIQNIKQR